MEREVGGGIGMENTCKPMAVSFQCMTKSTTIKKKNMLIPGGCRVRSLTGRRHSSTGREKESYSAKCGRHKP